MNEPGNLLLAQKRILDFPPEICAVPTNRGVMISDEEDGGSDNIRCNPNLKVRAVTSSPHATNQLPCDVVDGQDSFAFKTRDDIRTYVMV